MYIDESVAELKGRYKLNILFKGEHLLTNKSVKLNWKEPFS